MDMNGERQISAEIAVVWDALNNPEILGKVIPGCETIEKISDTELTATVKAKIGPVSARFKGKVVLSDLDPPNSYTISGEGQGGPAGFGKGSANVSLREDGKFTVLQYKASAQVGGKLAQIGTRLVDGAARKLTNEFFDNFAKELASSERLHTGTEANINDSPKKAELDQSRLGLGPFTWVLGTIGVIAALLLLFYTL